MPKKETIIIPITVYNCSNITIGIVFVSGTPNFAFNKYDFINSPTFPGIIDNANPEM